MNVVTAPCLSAYALELDAAAKKRYEHKVSLCGGVDPYLLADDDLKFEECMIPKVEGCDVKDYLVHATSFVTHEQLKAHKSMEAHNYLTSGFVQTPQFKEFGDDVIVRGKVRFLFRDEGFAFQMC